LNEKLSKLENECKLLHRNLESSESNIDILKTTIENMGSELLLYKSTNEIKREKWIQIHSDMETIERK